MGSDLNRIFDLSGQVVVLTGGKGQLGREFTKSLRAGGARVAVIDLPGKMADVVQGEKKRQDNAVLFVPGDVTNRKSLEEALARIETEMGPPTGLINNAAIDSPPDSPPEENGPFEDYPESSLDRILDVNVKGVFLCSQVFGGRMAEHRRGSIINICSIYGLVSPDQRIYEYRRAEGKPFFKPAAYSVSKSALLNLTRYLATYWGPAGVRVNTLTLGGVFNSQDGRFLSGYCGKVPLGRMARPDEYNGAIAFLLSGASSYMTGANLVMDGGFTAW